MYNPCTAGNTISDIRSMKGSMNMAIASTKKQNRILTVTLLVLLSAVAVLLIVTGQANKKESAPGTETSASETLREDKTSQPAKNAVEKTAPKTGSDKATETKPSFLGKDETKGSKAEADAKDGQKATEDVKKEAARASDETVEVSAPVGKTPTFVLPVSGSVVKEYAMEVPVFSDTMQDWRVHDGVDFACAVGDAVCAAADGKIGKVWQDPMMGTSLTIVHDGGAVSLYQGLAEEFPAPLKAGDTVTAGQVIASCGATALIECAEPDHIHYSLQIGGVSVDPGDYMTLTYAATEVED